MKRYDLYECNHSLKKILFQMKTLFFFMFPLEKMGKSGTRLYHLIVKTYWKHTNTSQPLICNTAIQIVIDLNMAIGQPILKYG